VSRRESVDNAIWGDPKFAALTANARYLYLWTFTNPRCGMAGVYKLSVNQAALETGLQADDVRAALDELGERRYVLVHDDVVWVRTRVKQLATKTPQVARSIAKDLAKIDPANPVIAAFADEYKRVDWLRHVIAEVLQTDRGGSPETEDSSPNDASSNDSPSAVMRQGQGQGKEGGPGETGKARSRRVDPSQLPDGFPDDLLPAVAAVLPVLRRVHGLRGGTEPTRRGVALAVQRFPDRDHAAVVGELEQWATAGNGTRRNVKDWSGTFASFLGRSPACEPRTGGGAAVGDELEQHRRRVAAAQRRREEFERGRDRALGPDGAA
jgi:hypothetical protein